MKKLFKDWKLFEILFLLISLITITVCFFLGNDKNIFSLIASLIGVITVLCGAKGLVIAPIINIIYNIIYISLSFSQKYYGEVLIYLFLMMPINIMTIISWLKNKSNENKNLVKINKISKKEYLYLGIITIISTIGFYFLLKVLNTNELIISTISLITSIIASYLMFRRCSNYAIAYIINDIILITLWALTIKQNGLAYLTMIISFIIFFINDIYGFINWKIREKKQNHYNKKESKIK